MLGPNSIAFSITDAPDTRAGDVLSKNNIKLGELPSGEGLYLQDVVTVLGNDMELLPNTKGVPVTDDNVSSAYGRFGSYYYDANCIKIDGAVFVFKSESNKWVHDFESNPLPEDDSPITFVMCMPDGSTSSILHVNNNLTLNTDQTIAFDYNVPATSASATIKDQKDLLVAGATLSRSTYDAAVGFDVTFYHPLVGIRFKLGNIDFGTTPSEISLNGIVSKGSCVFNPSTGAATWTLSENASDVVTYSFNPPTAQAQTNALDDGTGAYTFWLIPQMLSDNATLTVKVKTTESTEQTLTVNLKQALGDAANLQAGQLHTFTISPNFIEIVTTPDQDYHNTFTITNVGNIPAYIRAAIIDNWVMDGKVVGAGNGDIRNINTTDWEVKADGYYYTKTTVDPGHNAPALYSAYVNGSAPKDPSTNQYLDAQWTVELAAQGVADNSVWEH